MKTSQSVVKRSHAGRKKKQSGWQVFLLIVLIIVLIPALNYVSYLLVRGPLPAKVSVIAHRGGITLAPENTLTAFSKAAQVRADGIEMDIQMSSDGNLVIMHDETLDRTTNGEGFVKDFSLLQLRDLIVGGEAADGERIPTFADTLSFAKQNDMDVYAEIKSGYLYPGIEAKVIQEIKDAGYESRTKVQAFEPQTLENIAALDPGIQLIALYGLWKFKFGETQPGDADIVAPMAEMVLLNPWMIREAHKRGKQIIVWTGIIENSFTMHLLRALGVDGMIVNDPALLKKVLN